MFSIITQNIQTYVLQVYIYMCVCVCVCVYMYVYMCMCVRIYMYISLNTSYLDPSNAVVFSILLYFTSENAGCNTLK